MYYLLFSVHSKKQKKNITVGRKKNPHRYIYVFFIVADDLFILHF